MISAWHRFFDRISNVLTNKKYFVRCAEKRLVFGWLKEIHFLLSQCSLWTENRIKTTKTILEEQFKPCSSLRKIDIERFAIDAYPKKSIFVSKSKCFKKLQKSSHHFTAHDLQSQNILLLIIYESNLWNDLFWEKKLMSIAKIIGRKCHLLRLPNNSGLSRLFSLCFAHSFDIWCHHCVWWFFYKKDNFAQWHK